MLYRDEACTDIIQPIFVKNDPTDIRIAFESASSTGADFPRNIKYKNKSLKELFYYPRNGSFNVQADSTSAYGSYSNYGNPKFTTTEDTTPAAFKNLNLCLAYKDNMTRKSYNGGLSYITTTNYKTCTRNSNVVPFMITSSMSNHLYLTYIMTVSWNANSETSSYYYPHMLIYKGVPSGSSSTTQTKEVKLVGNYSGRCYGYACFQYDVGSMKDISTFIALSLGSNVPYDKTKNYKVMDMMIGVSVD